MNNNDFAQRHDLPRHGLFTDTIDEKTRAMLLVQSYKQSFIGQYTSLFCATIIFLGLFHHVSHLVLLSWYVYFVAVVFLRLITIHLFFHYNNVQEKLSTWRILFIIGAISGGIAWGLTGSLLFAFSPDTQRILIILILAGITAGAIPILAYDLIAVIAFLGCSLLPPIVTLPWLDGAGVYTLYDVALVAYFIYMISLAFKTYHLILTTIDLKFERAELKRNLHDATLRYEAMNKKFNNAASYDLLTGLENRTAFEKSFETRIKHVEHNQKKLALFFVNLDNFKFINDAYGFYAGDELLRQVTQRMKAFFEKDIAIARMGDDEFAVVIENIQDTNHIVNFARKLCEAMAAPFDIANQKITITCSIGISVYPIDGINVESLLKIAEQEMRYVKKHGCNNFHTHLFIEI